MLSEQETRTRAGIPGAPEPDQPQAVKRADVVRGVSWVGMSHVIGQLAWYSSLFIITALVAPKAFGSVTFAMVLVQVAWMVVGSGTRGSFVSMRGPVSAAQVRYATVINVGSGVLLGVVVAAAAQPLVDVLAPGSNVAVLQVLALSITFYGVSIVPMALLQKELKFKRRSIINATSAVTASAVAIAAGVLGLGVWALVLRQVLYQLLLAALAWPAAKSLLPRGKGGAKTKSARRTPEAKWFFAVAIIMFASMNIDYVIVGRFTSVEQLGLYSLAFTIAWVPVSQFAWQLGSVLFPTAARTEGLHNIAQRTLKAVRLTALVLCPFVPPAIVLAPAVVPQLLGEKWAPMVPSLQILLGVGAAHAMLAILREFLLGTGYVRTCARIDAVWVLGTAVAMVTLVPLAGIEGAALAHLVMLFPLAAAYFYLGLPRLGLSTARLLRSLGGVIGAVAVEAAVVLVAAELLSPLPLPTLVLASVAAILGLAAVAVVLMRLRSGAVADARSMFAALRSRPAATT